MRKICKADLHIHTPASKCYKGIRGEDGYIAILQKAKAEGVDLVAITDHNTVKGYNEFLQIYSSLNSSLALLKSLESEGNENLGEKIAEIDNKIQLYDEIKILPGVEITLNPGVHLIVICDENKVYFLQKLLTDLGYPDGDFGSEDGNQISTDILNFLQNPVLEDMIVFAPHVDSDKGLWQELKGCYRASILSSDKIIAMSCNNQAQRDNIIDVLEQPDYKRVSPLAFINASDAHDQNDVGNRTSYFSVDEVCFRGIMLALKAPEQNISDFRDNRIEAILKKIVASKKSICLEGVDRISDALCATINNQYGHIVIGTRQNTITGVKENAAEISQLINNALEAFSVRMVYLDITDINELLGNGKFVYIYTIRCHLERICYDRDNNTTFFSDHSGNIFTPTIGQIETKINDRIIKKYSIMENIQNEKIDNIRSELRSMKYPIAKQELCSKLYEKGSPLGKFIDVDIRETKDAIHLSENVKLENGIGVKEGNLYYLMTAKQRLEKSYLRISGIKIDSILNDYETKMYRHSGEHIFLTQLGGCYYICDDEFYVFSTDPYLDITLKSNDYSLLAIALWLKSSLSLWYSLRHDSDANLFRPNILLDLFLPENKMLIKEGEFEIIAAKLIAMEEQFVSEFSNISELSDDKHEENLITKFNNKADEILANVDSMCFDLLGISENDKALIINDISDSKYHNYFPSDIASK